jgi:hypothetical protein
MMGRRIRGLIGRRGASLKLASPVKVVSRPRRH